MKIIARIFKYFDTKGIKPTAFEKKIGLSNGYLGKMEKRNADIGESILIKIIENCPDINPEWLMLGTGNMIKKDDDNNKITNVGSIDLMTMIKEKDQEIAKLNREIGALGAEIVNLKKKLAQGPPDAGYVAATG